MFNILRFIDHLTATTTLDKVLIEMLPCRSNQQRQEIREGYKTLTGRVSLMCLKSSCIENSVINLCHAVTILVMFPASKYKTMNDNSPCAWHQAIISSSISLITVIWNEVKLKAVNTIGN